MPRFRKKPVEVTAERISEAMTIDTLEGPMRAKAGDWLITGVKGEKYSCDDEIFRETYEPVGDDARAALAEGGLLKSARGRPLLLPPGLRDLLLKAAQQLSLFDESKVARHPQGSGKGGQFAPKGQGGGAKEPVKRSTYKPPDRRGQYQPRGGAGAAGGGDAGGKKEPPKPPIKPTAEAPVSSTKEQEKKRLPDGCAIRNLTPMPGAAPTGIIVISPYSDEWRNKAKALGGKWDKGSKGWIFGLDKRDEVAAALYDVYGEPESTPVTNEEPPAIEKPVWSNEVKAPRAQSADGTWYVVVTSPYNERFVRGAKDLRGTWQSRSRTWRFPIAQEAKVYDLLAETYPPQKAEQEPAKEDAERDTFSLGEGYGGQDYAPGTVMRDPRRGQNGIVYVEKTRSKYYREDGLSFGVGDDRGYVYTYTVRPATQDEAAPVLAKEAERRAATENGKRRAGLVERIREAGEVPPGSNEPEGERISDTQNIYGGGDWFVVGDDFIWYVRNNGMDGDDWSRNNVSTGGAGAIGWRVPYDEELAAEIKSLQAVRKAVVVFHGKTH